MSGKNKGLGRGLDLIFEDNFTEEKKEDAGKIDIPMILLDTNPNQPRKSFSEEELRELAQSIEENGLVQPVVVRKKGERYELIAGERRFRAFKLLGRDKIPAVVTEADDLTAAKYSLIENLQREDLNPYEEAAAYRTLIDEYGLTQEEVADRVQKSRPAVTNALRLLSLGEGLQKKVASGTLSAGHARALLPLKDEALREKAAEEIAARSLSVRQTETLVASLLKQKDEPEKPKSNKIVVDYVREAEKAMTDALGRAVKFQGGQKRGRISLEFYSADDREALMAALMKMDMPWKKQEE